MSFDISHLLEQWDYQPGQVMVRRFKAKDGREKLQLRVDLGVLQMNAEGRPDGRRPLGHESLFEHFKAQLERHLQANDGDDSGFKLKGEDCARLQQEAIQYHHRYLCFFHLEDYDGVIRDTARNLAAFDFAEAHAETEELAWALQQFRPQLLMMRTRAKGTQSLAAKEHVKAVAAIEEGLAAIREFYTSHSRPELVEQSVEIHSLENWLEDVQTKRPLTAREKLERDLDDAVLNEDYEKAARVRDALRNLDLAAKKS
ncbi:MAG: UvrB/UvrC motif-containing protein [Verrucomicrobia bacterium]|nr:UvrB/UvrC motif-containing protein [Verrucomicrobiota bacterium]